MNRIARLLHRYAAVGILILGIVHTAYAVAMGDVSTDAIWFAGAGLALVFLGLLNVAAGRVQDGAVWAICRGANIVGVAYGAPAALVVGEPQGYVGLVLLVVLLVTSVATPIGPLTRAGRAAAAIGGLVLAGCAVAAAYMLSGCVLDGHPWVQIGTWAVLLPAFAWATWMSLRQAATG